MFILKKNINKKIEISRTLKQTLDLGKYFLCSSCIIIVENTADHILCHLNKPQIIQISTCNILIQIQLSIYATTNFQVKNIISIFIVDFMLDYIGAN